MMAVYDLEEQEQIDEIKAWWKRYGNGVLLLVTVAALTVAAVLGWRAYGDRQAAEAGELYVQLQAAVASNDSKKVQDISATMTDRYPRTGYAQFAALAAARAAHVVDTHVAHILELTVPGLCYGAGNVL